MAIALLDGSSGTVAIAIDSDGTDTAASSVAGDCLFRTITVDLSQGALTYVTFCSAGHVENRPTIKDTVFSLGGYCGTGNAYAKPGSMFALTSAATMTFTYYTGCSFLLNPVVTRDVNTVVAYGETSRIVEGKARSAPTITWVTS